MIIAFFDVFFSFQRLQTQNLGSEGLQMPNTERIGHIYMWKLLESFYGLVMGLGDVLTIGFKKFHHFGEIALCVKGYDTY